jgi:small subunit ribosomal protein S20
MPNIKQQEKRVRIAARQRTENLRYRSTVKTLTKRLRAAVEEGDASAIASEHRTLIRWIDKAASKGALHPNTAARKKAQAARLVASVGVATSSARVPPEETASPRRRGRT